MASHNIPVRTVSFSTSCMRQFRSNRIIGSKTRSFYAATRLPLQVTDKTPPTNKAPEGLSKDEIKAFETGTHPALTSAISQHDLDSIRIAKYAAPNTGHISLLTLNEPKSFNALSKKMLAELAAEVDAIHAAPTSDGIRALVIASASEKAFCAGANLKERATMSPDETQALLKLLRRTFTRLGQLPVPTIAAVHGMALGGGLELALCADLRVCASNATLALPEAALGIVPGAGGTHRLPAVIGRSRALEMMLTGRRLDGREAVEWGLANKAVDVPAGSEPADAQARVLAEAMAMAARIALKAPLSIRAIMQTSHDERGGQEAENRAYDSILHTEDRLEALQAFKEKRTPIFRGR